MNHREHGGHGEITLWSQRPLSSLWLKFLDKTLELIGKKRDRWQSRIGEEMNVSVDLSSMMAHMNERGEKEIFDKDGASIRQIDHFPQIVVFYSCKSFLAHFGRFGKIHRDLFGMRQSLLSRPFVRMIPKIGRQPVEEILLYLSDVDYQFADRTNLQESLILERLPIELVVGNLREDF